MSTLSGSSHTGSNGSAAEGSHVLSPIRHAGPTVGILETAHGPDTTGQVPPDTFQFFAALCEITADFLSQHELQQLRRARTVWQQWDQFSHRLWQSLDLTSVCAAIANDGRLLASCDRVSVLVRRGRSFQLKSVSGMERFDVVAFTGDGTVDDLVLSVDGSGNLQHNLYTDGSNGYESSIDLDSSVGVVETRLVADITQLSIFLGGGTDSVNFDDDFSFTFGSLSVAAEMITEVVDGSLTVSGITTLEAGAANDITLGEANDFGSIIIVSGNNVTLNDTTGIIFGGTSIISGNLVVLAGATITDDGTADVTVAGNARFDGTDITLADTYQFGSLTFTGNAVSITEADDTVLRGTSTADSLVLVSAATITDAAGTTISVSGLATLNAGSNTITLGDDAGDMTNFGSLNVTGGEVTISEDSDSILAGVVAASFSLTSTGSITIGTGVGEDVTATGGTVSLNAGVGGVTEAMNSIISADKLLLLGTGTYLLTQANDVSTLAANVNGAIEYVDADTLTVGSITVDGMTVTGITTSDDNVKLTTGGTLTINDDITLGTASLTLDSAGAVTQGSGDAITVDGLRLLGAGSFTLEEASNDVATLATDTTGAVAYRGANSLAIGTVTGNVGSTSGITTTDGDVTVYLVTGDLSVTDNITADNVGPGTTTVRRQTLGEASAARGRSRPTRSG